MDRNSASCPERAIRIFDIMALAVMCLAVFAIVSGAESVDAVSTGDFERSWADLLLAIVAPLFIVGTLWFEKRRRGADEDEYLRRLISGAAAAGVFLTICLWIGWDLLAQSWVRPPSGEQVIGVLLVSVALAYGWLRVRSA